MSERPDSTVPRGALQSEDGRSIGQLMGDVAGDLSTLMRQEVALAKAEVSQSGKRAGKGVGLLAGAAVATVMVLSFISVSAWWGLGLHIGPEWSALVVAAVWAVVAVILGLLGRTALGRVRGVPETAETLSKVPNALKGQEEMNR